MNDPDHVPMYSLPGPDSLPPGTLASDLEPPTRRKDDDDDAFWNLWWSQWSARRLAEDKKENQAAES